MLHAQGARRDTEYDVVDDDHHECRSEQLPPERTADDVEEGLGDQHCGSHEECHVEEQQHVDVASTIVEERAQSGRPTHTLMGELISAGA